MIGWLWAGAALAADGGWLGPAAEAPDAVVDLDVEGALNVGVYGVGPQLGAHLGFAPVRPLAFGATAAWVGPTATLSAVGARALVLDRAGVRIAAIVRGAGVTGFDGRPRLWLAGAGVAAEGGIGRLGAGLALPVIGLEQSMGHHGLRWLPGLWDASATVALGRERRVRLELGAATSLVLLNAGCTWDTSWGRFRIGLVGNGVANALGASAGASWGTAPGASTR